MRSNSSPAWRIPRLMLRAALVAVLLALSFGVATPAQAAAPNGSITPFVNCIWDNGNGTVTASVGYRSSNAGTVTEPIGNNNRFSPGAQNRGQPTTFLTGTRNNVFAVTVTYQEIQNDINWYVTGNSVNVESIVWCQTKPVSVIGSVPALLLGIALTLAIGLPVMAARRVGREVSA